MGDPSGSMSVLYTDDPKSGNWNATPAILHDLQDPDLFIDDDGQAYLFWGSSNVYPLRGKKLNKDDRFLIEGETVELFGLDMPKHGWERFGENHTDTVLGGYMEGCLLYTSARRERCIDRQRTGDEYGQARGRGSRTVIYRRSGCQHLPSDERVEELPEDLLETG